MYHNWVRLLRRSLSTLDGRFVEAIQLWVTCPLVGYWSLHAGAFSEGFPFWYFVYRGRYLWRWKTLPRGTSWGKLTDTLHLVFKHFFEDPRSHPFLGERIFIVTSTMSHWILDRIWWGKPLFDFSIRQGFTSFMVLIAALILRQVQQERSRIPWNLAWISKVKVIISVSLFSTELFQLCFVNFFSCRFFH